MTANLNRAIVYVSNMERSVAFYRDVLGLPLRFESPHWSEFNTGDVTLALHVSMETGSAQPAGATGQIELSLTVEDIDQACEAIRDKGVEISDPKVLGGVDLRAAYLRDPDGLTISLTAPVS